MVKYIRNFLPKGVSNLIIKGILFDFDGTLGNTTDLILQSFKKTLWEFLGQEVDNNAIIKTFGLPLRQGLAEFAPGREEEMVAYYRNYNNIMHDKLIKPFPYVKEGLASIRKMGIKAAVVTSKTSQTATRGLRCLDIEEYISVVIGCDLCSKHKPDPYPMLLGAQALGLKPMECLCVGDSPYDLLSGKAAGCRTVAVEWSSFDKTLFNKLVIPDLTIKKLTDLPKIIKTINQKEKSNA